MLPSPTTIYNGANAIAAIIPIGTYTQLRFDMRNSTSTKSTIIPLPSNYNPCWVDKYNNTSITDFTKFSNLTNCFIVDNFNDTVYCDSPCSMIPVSVASGINTNYIGIRNFRIKSDFVNLRTPRESFITTSAFITDQRLI